MKKRVLSMVLALCMVTALLPVNAFADDALTPTPEPTAQATTEPTPEAEPSAAPTETATAEPSAAPEETATAEPSAAPEASATAEASAAPEASATAEPSATPEASATAEPSATPEATAEPTSEPGESTIVATVVISIDPNDLPDSDELFAGYVESTLYDYGDIMLFGAFGTSASSPLNASEQAIYTQLKTFVKSVAEGTVTNTRMPTIDTSALDIKLLSDGNGNPIVDSNGYSSFDQSAFDLHKVMTALLADCPYDLYWFDKTMQTSISDIHASGADCKITSMAISFPVATDYRGGDTYTTNPAKTTAASTAAATAQGVVAANAGKSDYEKLKAYKDYICSKVNYNHTAADNDSTPFGDPWQLINVFDNNSATDVVCEGYSKAFQYLCDLSTFSSGVTCYTVTGNMAGGTGAGGHMWNIVTIGGNNYLVDVTNSDTDSVGANGTFFLAGYNSGSIPSYVISNDNGSNVTYTYDADTQSMYGSSILTLASSDYVAPALEVSVTPATATVTYGYSTAPVITATAAPSAGTTYEWFNNSTGTAVSVGTSAAFTVPTGLNAGTYTYYCKATNSGNTATSATVTITVDKAAGVVTNNNYPASFTYKNAAVTAPVAANFTNNTGALTFTWYKNPDLTNPLTAAPSAVGSYTLSVQAAESGNYTAASVQIPVSIAYLSDSAVASLAPTNLGSNGWYKGNTTIVPPSGYTISDSATGTFGASIPATVSGTNPYTYYLKNSSGEITDAKTIDAKIDSVAPVIGTPSYSVTPGLLGWLFHNNKITVTVPVSDAQSNTDVSGIDVSGMYKVTYALTPEGGTTGAETEATLSSGTCTFDVNADFKGDIIIKAYDNAGNTATVTTSKMAVEGNAPTLDVSSSTTPSTAFATTWYTTAQTIYVNVGDADSGIKTVTYTVDGGAAQTLFTATAITANRSSTISVSEGDHTYVITVTDNALNTTSKTVTVKQDTAAPTKPTLTVTTAATDTKATLTAASTDAGSGVKEYTLTEASGKISPVTNTTGVFALTGLTASTDYSFTVKAADNAGLVSAASDPCTFTTEKTSLSGATVNLTGTGSLTYNGTSQVPSTITVVLGSTTILAGEYDVTYSNSNGGAGNTTNAGTITVTVTAKSGSGFHYSGSATTTYTIGQAEPTITWGSAPSAVTYTGSEAAVTAPTVGLQNSETYGGTIQYFYKESSDTDYTAGKPTNVGTYSIKAIVDDAGSNYTTKESVAGWTLTINKSTPTIAISGYPSSKTYDADALANPTAAQMSLTGAAYSDVSFTWKQGTTTLSAPPTDAGTYTVTASIAATNNTNAASVTSGSITISPKALPITASAQTLTYGESIATGVDQVTYPALAGSDTLTGITLAASTANVTTSGTITPSAATISGSLSNYTVSYVAGALTINPAMPTITWGSTSATVTYTGSTAVITAPTVALVNSETYSGTPALTYSYKAEGASTYTAGLPTNVGTYSVKASLAASGNYAAADSADFTLIIDRATPTVTGVAYSGATLYPTTPLATVNAGITSYTANPAGGTLELDSATLAEGTANYKWTYVPTDTANYNNATGTVSLTVVHDDLTAISVGTTTPTKTAYTYGEPFDTTGLTVTAAYASGGTKVVTGDVTFPALSVGDTSITLSYTEDGITKTCVVSPITVAQASLTGYSDLGKSVRYTNTAVQTVNKEDFGLTVPGTFALHGTVTDAGSVLAGAPTIGSQIKYNLASGLTFASQTVTIPVTFTPTDTNYSAVNLTLTVTLTDKDTATLSLAATASGITYGDSVTYTATLDKDHLFLNALDTLDGTIDFYLGNPTSGGVLQSSATVSGSGAAASITLAKDKLTAGSHDIYAVYSGNSNYAELSANTTTTVSKKALAWDTSDMWAAKQADGNNTATLNGTLKVSGEISGDAAGFTYTSLTGVYDSAAAGDRTVTVTVTGAAITNPNYELPAAAPTFAGKITAVTDLTPPATTGSDVYKLEMESGISKIPATLPARLNTPAKIEAEMIASILNIVSDIPASNIAVYDITLLYKINSSTPWTEATAANFPAGGITVVLPYPAGTNAAGFDFVVTHMFTTGSNPGTTETIAPEKTAAGLKFTLYSLSPVAVGYKAIRTAGSSAAETYCINSWWTDGGVATPPATVNVGTDHTVYITPNKGYKVGRVVVDGKDVGAVTSYTFSNVHRDHTLGVYFVKTGTSVGGSPKTGDNVPVKRVTAAMVLSSCIMLMAYMYRRKEDNQ